jgi:hypothetical protein
VRQGQWRIPAEPPYLFIDNTKEYVRRYKNPNPPCLAGQKAYFHALLTFLKEENIKVVVVGMPSLQSNRDILPPAFWSQFKTYLHDRNSGLLVVLLSIYLAISASVAMIFLTLYT